MSEEKLDLAKRIRSAREAIGLTQEQVANELRISRPVIAQIEAGNRAVNSLELAKLAKLLGLGVAELLTPRQPITHRLMARFRATVKPEEVPVLERTLLDVLRICRMVTRLEKELGTPARPVAFAKLEFIAPQNKMDAAEQGAAMAKAQRGGLQMGPHAPVWDLAGQLEMLGIRVAEHALPADVSGFSFRDEETGPVIVINGNHPLVRRQFSCAHEFAHLLVDTGIGPVVSVTESRDPIETRANAFAANFLAPSDGILVALEAMAKKPKDVDMFDVGRLAFNFRVSYDVMAYRLSNVGMISLATAKDFIESEEGRKFATSLWPSNMQRGPFGNPLAMWVLRVTLQALRKEVVSRKKAQEICADVGVPPNLLEMELTRLEGSGSTEATA